MPASTRACARETTRDVVVVRGSRRARWLQGQVSQDLASLDVGDSAETLVLSPQGKVDADRRATMLADDTVMLDAGTGYGEMLLQRLRRFSVRVRAELESGTVSMLEVRGPVRRIASPARDSRCGRQPMRHKWPA